MKNYTLSDFTKNEDEILGNFYEGMVTMGSQKYGVTIYLDGSKVADVEQSVNRFFADVDNFSTKSQRMYCPKVFETLQ